MTKFLVETPWDTSPDSTSQFHIYDADDHWILGNATDTLKKYDGDRFVDLEGAPPKGNIFAVYKDRLMVAGDPSYPHRIWYSHIRNGEGWSKNTDWIDVYPEDGGKINGLGIQDDELKVSKDNGRLYGWRIFEDGDPTNSTLRIIEDDKGALNVKSLATMDDVFYYLDRNRLDTIPMATRGGISFIVDEVIKGIQEFQTAVGANDGKVYVALGDVNIEIGDMITLSNVVLIYDSINQAFYLRDNVDARVFSKFIDTDGQEDIYFGDSSGRVFKIDSGTQAGSTNIQMRIRTQPYGRENGMNMKIKKVGIHMDDPDGTRVYYRTNLNHKFDSYLGIVKHEPVHWFETKAVGPLFQLEFTHSNANARPRLIAIEIDYDEEGHARD